jgi:hypothetical protein
MKQVIFTFAITSSIILAGCTKTKQADNAIASTTKSQASVIDVDVDDGEFIVLINGDEQVIELSEIFDDIAIEHIDGEISISVMAFGDDEVNEMEAFDIDGENVHVKMIVNGEEIDGLPEDMVSHVMQMIAREKNTDANPMHNMILGVEGGSPEDMRTMRGHTIRLKGGEGGSPEDMRTMRGHTMRMMGGEGGSPEGMGNMRVYRMRMMDGEGGPHRGMGGNPQQMMGELHLEREHDVPEEVQFIDEIGILGEVAITLEGGDAVALMGINMIRDVLEGEIQLEALERIIDESLEGTAVRNAALIVLIQALKDSGDDGGAADLLVDLVLSN